MKIEALALTRLHNEEHYRFYTEFKVLVDTKTPAALGIAADYPTFTTRYNNEGIALDVLIKSKITDDLLLADLQRDNTFRGIADTVKANLRHFKPANQEAAKRLKVVFDRYGDVPNRPYEKETAAITALVIDLQAAPCLADITTLGLTEWVTKLKTDNDAFIALLKARDAEQTAKPQIVFKEARIQLDAIYKTLIERINALAIVNGDTNYKGFMLELNQVISRFQDLLAQRQGWN
ncbi:MAG: hypothetical protein JXQ69_07300, partial [Paludibacteraceae bacterium]|nr:hypothetical protein [Paludibacteraceae bacterium]